MQWRLRTVMHARGFKRATHLRARLIPYEIELSRSQLTRIVAGKFLLLRIDILDALCEVLACSVGDLLVADGHAPPVRGRSVAATHQRIRGSMQAEPLGKLGSIRPVGVRIRELR